MTGFVNNILQIEDFLDEEQLSTIRHFIEGEIGVINKVEVPDSSGSTIKKQIDAFYSERIHLQGIDWLARSICERIFSEIVPQTYNQPIEWYEYPHVIRYRKGGKYEPHADAEQWRPEEKKWVRTVDRDFSAIVYVNDDFQGGGLYFPEYEYRIIPKPGMLVCFPSTGKYVHTAEPVLRGNRYAFVTWAAAKGTNRAQNNARCELVYL